MQDRMRQVDAFLDRYGMTPQRTSVDVCAKAFRDDMERGLRGDQDACMLMLPTYLSLDERMPENHTSIVIDAGGTHFRIGLVTLNRQGAKVEDLRVFPMPGSQEPITWEDFVSWVAEAVLPFTNRSRRVGFCFSYAAESLPNQDGRVLSLSKQVQISCSEGKELGRDISAVLADRGVPDINFVVLNDTVAALLGGAAGFDGESFDGYIGLIYGTGVNTCYVEQTKELKKLDTVWDRDTMLINMESAQFDGAPRGDFDERLDRSSVDPGLCHYEKMVSGRYQGELIFYALMQGCEDGLFSSNFARNVRRLSGLSMVQADEFCAKPYGGGLLAAACGTEEDREAVYTIIDRIVERSARLVCANLAGILLQTGAGAHIHRPACIVAEGSGFYKGHLFRGKLERLCAEYITEKQKRFYVFRQVLEANLVGTAMATLLRI